MSSVCNYTKKLELRKNVLDAFITSISDYKLVQVLKKEHKLVNDMLFNLYYALTEDLLKNKTNVRLSKIIFGDKNILNILDIPEDYAISSEIDEKLLKAIFLYETDLVCKSKGNKYIIFRLKNLTDWTELRSVDFTLIWCAG